MDIFIRGMLALDLPEVAGIEYLTFKTPHEEDRLAQWTRFDPPRPRIGIVAECRVAGDPWEHLCIGYALYTVERGGMTLDRLAVHPLARRQGVGRRLLAEVQKRTLTHCVPRAEMIVPEAATSALYFARACGVRATGVVRGHFVGGTLDGIRFTVPGGFAAPKSLSAAPI